MIEFFTAEAEILMDPKLQDAAFGDGVRAKSRSDDDEFPRRLVN